MSDSVDMNEERTTIPERIVYNPQTLIGTVLPGKTLKIEISPQGAELLTVEAENGIALSYSITVSVKEVGG